MERDDEEMRGMCVQGGVFPAETPEAGGGHEGQPKEKVLRKM